VEGKSLQQIAALDSASFAAFTTAINKKDGNPPSPMTREEFAKYADSAYTEVIINFSDRKYKSRVEYDTAQAIAASKDGWIKKKLIYKQIELNEKYNRSGSQLFTVFFNALIHRLPQMLFISLPLLALLLKLLYKRQRQFYFVSHGIFCIHLYIFIFIDIVLIIAFKELYGWSHWGIFNFMASLLGFAAFVYTYKAMRNFYQQGRAKTILKFLLVSFLNLLVLVLLFFIFVMFSLFTI